MDWIFGSFALMVLPVVYGRRATRQRGSDAAAMSSRRARPDLGDSAKDVERQRHNLWAHGARNLPPIENRFRQVSRGNCSVIAGLLKSIFNKEW